MRVDMVTPEMRGLFDQGLSKLIPMVNSALRTLLARTADQLDVGSSRVRIEFGRDKDGGWSWKARLRGDDGKTRKLGRGPGPLEALADLAEKASSEES